MEGIEQSQKLLQTFFLREASRQLSRITEMATQQNWSYEKYLEILLEEEWNKRQDNKKARHLKQSGLPEGKTLAALDPKELSIALNRNLNQLLEGTFVDERQNILAFGLPGRGKTHYLCAIAREMIIRYGYRVRFIRVYKLVQELLDAKKNVELPSYLKKQSKYDLIVLDDIGYVKQSREEMEVFFTFLADCYEERSLLISSNQNFSQWGDIFQDKMITMAAIDRLVHHCIILEFDGESQRLKKKK